MLRSVGKLAGYTVAAGCGAHCVFQHVVDLVWLEGPSMETTIFGGDVVINRKHSVIRRGDIITARSATNPKEFVCKRVVGLFGDKIENPTKEFSQNYVPKGYMWLEGDNKGLSIDSRKYGPVPAVLCEGKIVFRLWPPRRFGFLHTKDHDHVTQKLNLRFKDIEVKDEFKVEPLTNR